MISISLQLGIVVHSLRILKRLPYMKRINHPLTALVITTGGDDTWDAGTTDWDTDW